MNPFKLFGRIP